MPLNKSDSEKSNEKADKLRSEGNKLFIERQFFDAILKYNKSLCYAEKGSEAMGLAYANRSAIYYEMNFFEKCLNDIQFARDNGYPERSNKILDKRAEKCVEQIKIGNEAPKDADPFDFIKLSYETNPKLTYISNCLELRRNDKFGRFVVTNRDLKVGDVVALENPYFKTIKSDSRYDGCQETNMYQRCGFCLKSNLLDLIPCEICVSTMYCSAKCLANAQEHFHKYECPIVNMLIKSGVMQMTMRIFFQALSIFGGSISELENFYNANCSSSMSVYDVDLSNDNVSTTAKNNLISLLNLARNNNDYASDSPEKLFDAHSHLSSMWKTHERFIRKFVLRILQVGDSNFHGICGWSLKKNENTQPQLIGIGCYPFMSLLNHSCSPNVNRIYVEDKILLLVESPISKGGQLFDCYKHTFLTQPRVERQFTLLHYYGFSCDCIACRNDFPIFIRLKSINKAIYKAAKKGTDELSKLDCNQAKKRFTEYCDLIQKHHRKAFTSLEIVLLQECILQCISIVIKPTLVIP